MKRFKINLKSPNQLQAIQTRRISISALTNWDFLEEVGSEKKNKPNNRSDTQSSNLNENKLEDNCAADMKTFQRTSSATDMKRSQGISSAIDTESFWRISSAADEKAESGKTGKVEKGAYYGTREERITDKKNEEEEAVDFETEYETRHKSQKKTRSK